MAILGHCLTDVCAGLWRFARALPAPHNCPHSCSAASSNGIVDDKVETKLTRRPHFPHFMNSPLASCFSSGLSAVNFQRFALPSSSSAHRSLLQHGQEMALSVSSIVFVVPLDG